MMMLVFPLKKIWISNDCPGHGYNAYDLGWWDYDRSMPDDTGRNPILYAMGEGIVLCVVAAALRGACSQCKDAYAKKNQCDNGQIPSFHLIPAFKKVFL